MNPTIIARTFSLCALLTLCACRRTEQVPLETTASFRVMERPVTIEVAEGNAATLPLTLSVARDMMRSYRAVLDHRDADSEVGRLNRLASNVRIPISREMRFALVHARRLHRETGGLFDVTAGPLRIVYGFNQTDPVESVPEEVLQAALGVVGQRYVEITDTTLHFLNPSVSLDFSAMLDGYLLDRTILDIRQTELGNLRVSVGNSTRVLGERAPTDPWRLVVPDPSGRLPHLGNVLLLEHAAASICLRDEDAHWVGSERVSGVLNPLTGLPARDHAMAVVTAPFATLADVYAKVLLLTGPEGIRTLIENHPDAEALVLTEFPEWSITLSEGFPLEQEGESLPFPVTIINDPPPKDATPEAVALPRDQN